MAGPRCNGPGLLLAAVMAAAVPVAAAGPPGSGAPFPRAGLGGELVMESRNRLAEIHSTELAETPAIALPPGRFIAEGLDARGPALLPDFAAVVTREIPDLWRLRVAEDTSPATLEVTHDFISARGREDALSHREEDSEIQVRLRPIPPLIVERSGGMAEIQGGVVLELDVAAATSAGTYLGSLTVTVTQL